MSRACAPYTAKFKFSRAIWSCLRGRRNETFIRTLDWVKLTKPKRSRNLGPDQVVIEYDEDDYSENSGYGHIGRLVDPFGTDLKVAWLDGKNLTIDRTKVLLPKQPGAIVMIDGIKQRVVRYTDAGVVLTQVNVDDVTQPKPRTLRTRQRKQPSPQTLK